MGKPPFQLLETGDGTHTIYHTELDETYHSSHGALTESNHVFIDQGLRHWLHENPTAKEVRVLEVGMGTGLNAALALEVALSKTLQMQYLTLEPYPLQEHLWRLLNYQSLLPKEAAAYFKKLHTSNWGETVPMHENFSFCKLERSLADFDSPSFYDLIFYDAFAPSKQPEMWETPMVAKAASRLAKGGYLVTYSSQGMFRRALQSLGLEVKKIPGPPGKREMTRAHRAS